MRARSTGYSKDAAACKMLRPVALKPDDWTCPSDQLHAPQIVQMDDAFDPLVQVDDDQ